MTDFLTVVSELDGSVSISGEIEANPSDPEATRCYGNVFVDVPDLAGNMDGESLQMEILTRGALVTYTPEDEASEPSPFGFSLEILPVGDVDPSLTTIYLETYDCGDSDLNGNPFNGDWFSGDVTPLLDLVIGPDGVRTYSGTITTTNSCEIELRPEMGEIVLDSVWYEVIYGGRVTADPPSDLWPPVDPPLSFSISIDPFPGVDLSATQMLLLPTGGPCGLMDLNGNTVFGGDVTSYLDLVVDLDGQYTYSGTLDITWPFCDVTFTPMLGAHTLTKTYYHLVRSDVVSYDPEPGMSYPSPLSFSISVQPVVGLDPSNNHFYLWGWDCGTADLNGTPLVPSGGDYGDITPHLSVEVAPDDTHTYSGTISFAQSCEIWIDSYVLGWYPMNSANYQVVVGP